jgi:hypothetical protein
MPAAWVECRHDVGSESAVLSSVLLDCEDDTIVSVVVSRTIDVALEDRSSRGV